MARPRKPEPATTSLVSSAVRLPIAREGRVTAPESWQAEAWRLYDTVGELRFVANWVGNLMSRARLVAVEHQPGLDKPLQAGPVADSLHEYFGGEAAQAEMLRLTGVHLTVVGEVYHVYRASDRSWHVLAAGKVRQSGSGAKATLRADFGDGMVPITRGSDLVIRVWQPHPMEPQRADSPVRANLATLHEIERSSQTVAATLKSRLAGAGVFLLPSEMTFPTPTGAPADASQADLFMLTLGEAMLTPVSDPDDPSAVVPIVVTAPADAIAAAKHIEFARTLAEEVRLTRDNAVKRFALGMDIPPEVLTGLSDVNHWNAWLADEASTKVHIEPRLAIVANAVYTGYVAPSLVATDADYGVAADTSLLRIRPNRSREAMDLWDRGELTGVALRRETGFGEEDKPSRNDMAEWLLRKIALGSTSPDQTQAAIEALGVDLPALGAGPAKGRPDDLDNRRTVTRDARDSGPRPALLAAAEVLVYRALERAGNRLRSKHSYRGSTPAADLYLEFDGDPDVLLADAFTCVDRVTDAAPADFALALDTYCRGLIATKTPHSRYALARHLSLESAS